MNTQTMAATRARLSEALDTVGDGTVLTITRRSKPAAVLISAQRYAALAERQRSAAGLLARLQAWRSQNEPLDGVFDDLRDTTSGRASPW